MAMDVHTRATAAARVLDLLGTVVLAIGGVSAAVCLIGAVWSLIAGASITALLCFVVALGAVMAGGLGWAGVTVATVVCGYVAERTSTDADLDLV